MRKPGSMEIVMHQILFNIYFIGAYFLHIQKVKCYYNHFNIDISFLWTVFVVSIFTNTSWLCISFLSQPPLAPLSPFLPSVGRESLWPVERILNFNLPTLFTQYGSFSHPSSIPWDQLIALLTSSGSRIHTTHIFPMMLYLGVGSVVYFQSSLLCLIQCQCSLNHGVCPHLPLFVRICLELRVQEERL